MPLRFVLPAILALAMPAAAQDSPPPTIAAPGPGMVRVVLTTTEGAITIDLDSTHAPITTANFLRYLDTRRFDGTAFYRAMKLGPDLGLIQAGLRNDPKRLFAPIAHEPTSSTGISHTDATISMARDKPGTATADFFITIGALPSLDADPKASGDNQGFAAFGHVAAGMEVVHRILYAPTSPTSGAGVMRGQMLAPTIRILSARRSPTGR